LASNFVEYETIEASDGAEALDQLSEDVSFVICDVNMPNMDGFEFCRSVRSNPAYARFAALPIILLTSRDSERDYMEGVEVGTTLYVPKPFDNVGLRRAVDTVLGR
jgi:DNA-binding response OmpR family regulator